MATATLSASPRSGTGKGVARTLRQSGQIPGGHYGHGREAQPLALNAREFGRLLEHVTASTVIELALDGKTSRNADPRIQRHPYKREVLTSTFLELVAGEKGDRRGAGRVRRPTPAGVRDGGILDQSSTS